MKISKAQVRIHRFFQKDIVQHLGFGVVVFLIVFCFVAIHAWYQGKAELLESFGYKREAFWKVFREALGYTLLLGPPVYVNLFFVYRGRLQRYLGQRLLSQGQRKSWSFYLFLFFSFITASLFALLYAPFIRAAFDIVNQEWYELTIVILFVILCTTGVSYTKEAIGRSRELERKARLDTIRRRREAEMELNFIKKQIRPHFLFNTLANLQVLARRKSEHLPELIGELSRLLRHLVYKTNEKFVPLEDELRFIKGYLELQRLQVSPSTELVFEQEGQAQPTHRIAPMVLLLFVENCFKHYNRNGRNERFIRIRFEIANDVLHACIQNSFKPYMRNEDNHRRGETQGVGLATALENLDLLYDDVYHLAVRSDDGVYAVNLNLPLL